MISNVVPVTYTTSSILESVFLFNTEEHGNCIANSQLMISGTMYIQSFRLLTSHCLWLEDHYVQDLVI
jgi:hypothetical protein